MPRRIPIPFLVHPCMAQRDARHVHHVVLWLVTQFPMRLQFYFGAPLGP